MLGSVGTVFEHEKRGSVHGIDSNVPQAWVAIAECAAAAGDARGASAS